MGRTPYDQLRAEAGKMLDDPRLKDHLPDIVAQLRHYTEGPGSVIAYLDELTGKVMESFPNFNDRLVPNGIINLGKSILQEEGVHPDELRGRMYAVKRIADGLTELYRLR